jgi:hypothetical protein
LVRDTPVFSGSLRTLARTMIFGAPSGLNLHVQEMQWQAVGAHRYG